MVSPHTTISRGYCSRLGDIAWPVNFNLSLQSFEPNVKSLRQLVDIALSSPLPTYFTPNNPSLRFRIISHIISYRDALRFPRSWVSVNPLRTSSGHPVILGARYLAVLVIADYTAALFLLVHANLDYYVRVGSMLEAMSGTDRLRGGPTYIAALCMREVSYIVSHERR